MAPKNPPSEPSPPEKAGGGKIANSLVALGSAAVLTVYAAGYVRTRAAAERFSVEAADLRMSLPVEGVSGPAVALAPPDEAEAPVESAVPSEPASAPEIAASVAPSRTEVSAPVVEARAEAAPATSPAEPPATPVAPSPVPSAPAPATTTTATDPSADASTAATEPPVTPPAPPTPPPAPAPAPAAPATPVNKDGRYLGWGYSRHGDIEAAVVIQDGRIISSDITQCLTRYSCDVIAQSPGQVLERQSPFIDLVSGATESANAYANAIYRALKASQK